MVVPCICDPSFSLAAALNFAAHLHQFRREWQAAQERAETLIALSNDQEFPSTVAVGTIVRGQALAEEGRAAFGSLASANTIDTGYVESLLLTRHPRTARR